MARSTNNLRTKKREIDPLLALRAQLEERLEQCARLMERGVRVMDPATTYLDPDVEVGEGTVVFPNTTISGSTIIGRDCRIGPNSVIADSRIGDDCQVFASVIEGSALEAGVDVGPFSHLRPGSYLETGVHVGNYVEVKASRLGAGTKAGHFTYIGDATVGRDVNIGAGSITCNYDGKEKHRTVIEEGAFIGCDTMLVAPVRVGGRAVTGAGAVVTRDVAPGEQVTGVPARAAEPQPAGRRRTEAPRVPHARRKHG